MRNHLPNRKTYNRYRYLTASCTKRLLRGGAVTICLLTIVTGFSQKLMLSVKNVSLTTVFEQIEKQTDYVFFYDRRIIEKATPVSVDFSGGTIKDLLGEVLKNQPLTYSINKRRIMVKRLKTSKTAQDAAALPTVQPFTVALPAGEDLDLTKPQTQQVLEIAVKGKVVDEKGEGLPGVSILIKGTTRGSTTNADGGFSVNVPDKSAILVFSFVGYLSQEVPVGNNSTIDITLKVDEKSLEEVVVVGYGTQKKANLTGAVSSVNFEDQALQSRSLTNVSTMLSGMSSGIRIQQINGAPSENNNAQITVRGTGSLNASSAPLVIIDGQIADINSVSPNDVASVSILKDAASAAIYGSRASNGVILITTKTGKNTQGKISFNYDSFVGKKDVAYPEALVSYTPDYMGMVNRMRTNSGQSMRFTQEEIEEYRAGSLTDPLLYPSTDWLKAVSKNNTIANHHFSARGGNEKVSFYSAFDYMGDNGLVVNTGFKRYNFRNNLDYKVNKWLKLGNNFTLVSTRAEPATSTQVFQWMRGSTPAVLPIHPDGRFGAGSFRDGSGGGNHPLLSAHSRRGESKGTQIQGKVYAVLTPLEGLSITGSYFNDFRVREGWSGTVPIDQWNFKRNSVHIDRTTGAILSLATSNYMDQRQVIDVFADYKKSLGNHNLNVLVGYNQEYFFTRSSATNRAGLLSYDTPVLNAASGVITTTGSASDFAMRSVFGRLSYDYKGKYLFESNLRYDGSSRFAPDSRWGLFPSFSAGWVISQEDFWAPLSSTFNDFKLRASWGRLGNNGIDNYEWQSFYSAANYARDNSVVSGLRYNTFGNPNITWETTNVFNVGVDLRLFNTLTLDLNYYNKLTNNILSNIPIPLVNGGIGAPRINSAEVRNSGFEGELRYSRTLGKVSFNLGANFAYNKNRITKYKGDLIEARGINQAWTEGQPIGIFWVREVDRIIQSQEETNSLLAEGYTFHPQTPGPGDFLYKDANGDKVINDNDRVLKGNPIPLITYGGSAGLRYAGFDLNIFFDGVSKWDRYLAGSVYTLNHSEGFQFPRSYLESWTAENPSTEIPKIYTGNDKNNVANDFYLQSSAYLKIRSIQLGYSLPVKLLKKVGVEKFRLFANVENYFMFTSWPSLDPESIPTGTEHFTYPLTKTFSMGVNIGF
jgi:TonB-linked SusC/RagA family outer membrane protein